MSTDLYAVLPEIVLTLGGCVLMLGGAFAPGSRRIWPFVTVLVLGLAWLVRPEAATVTKAFLGAIEVSRFSAFVDAVLFVAVLLVTLIGSGYYERDRESRGELWALILWTQVGLMIMTKATDLLALFVGLELASVSMYVLVAWFRNQATSDEAALKFFITGAFASAILLYGIAILYGRSGGTALHEIVASIAGRGLGDGATAIALFLVIVGAGYKLGLAPFHAWIPDTYQGAPTPAAALISVAPKAAAAVLLARIAIAIHTIAPSGRFAELLALLAVITIFVGNLGALPQRDIKRMLAYSGIAHMGYVTIAFAVFGEAALTGVLVYLLGYAFSNIGAFAVAAAVTRGEDRAHPINDLAGLSRSRPFLAFAMMIFMISLAGVPPTAGFAGKFLVFGSAIGGGKTWLAVAGIVGSVISAAFYLRVVHTMYVREVPPDPPRSSTTALADLGVVCACLGTLAIGLFPNAFAAAAQEAARALLGG